MNIQTLFFSILLSGLVMSASLIGQDTGITAFLDPETPPDNTALIQVSLTNFGTDTIKNVIVHTEINGIEKTPYRYVNPPLRPGRKIDLYTTSHRFNSNATYKMRFWTSQPNGTSDTNTANDTLTFTLKGAEDLENNDAGITTILAPNVVSDGSKLVRVRLKNFGIEPLENVQIAWRINGVDQRPYNYNGPALRSRREIDIYIGRVRFTEGETYTISARTISPNGVADERTTNDRAVREYN